MLLFDRYGIRIFAVELPSSLPARGPGRELAQRTAVKRLLREIFPHRPDISIGHTPAGAPFLTGGNSSALPPVSISHSRGLAAIAVGEPGMRLGIDTETPDRVSQLTRVASRFLSPQQTDIWGSDAASLCWAWCIKEAAYKAALRPGLALSWIPLPLEIPLNTVTPAGTIEIAGISYHVLQVDTSPIDNALVMLVFSDPAPCEAESSDEPPSSSE